MSRMKWEDMLSSNRFGAEKQSKADQSGRTGFHQDCDRITFSSPFRRLGRKTQVHPLVQNDHIHTRLTHSLEVASVGRSLGIICGEKIKNELKELPHNIYPSNIGQILQAVSLAHDIGNPPFGHAGEEAIKAWFKDSANAHILEGLTEEQRNDFKNFEGNAQGFRILTRLEHNVNKGGMRLTYTVLGAMLKYPWTSSNIKKEKKFGVFQAEKDYLNKIAEEVKLIKTGDNLYCRHPLALLLEAADDICYRILDLEDAYEMKILSFDEICDVLKDLCNQQHPRYKDVIASNISNRRKLSFIRTIAIGGAIDGVVDTFVNKYDEIMRGEFEGSLIKDKDSKIKKPLKQAYDLDKEMVFNERRKIELEIGCYSVIGILLNAFCSAVKEMVTGKNISFKSSRVLEMIELNNLKKGDNLYESFLKATDYLSGMTDNYASRMAKQIAGMGG